MSIAVPLYGFGTGGGNSLYYSVVCSTTEPAKKEGRIWVKSSVEMTQFEVGNAWTTAKVGVVVVGGTPGGANPTSTNKILDLINTKVAGIPNRLKLTPASCKQVQGSTGNWVSVDAYVCHSNTWIQFSSVFSATINITYPAGSTCTCKNGSTTLTAPNTSGTWACTVPNAGTWTVSCTNGTDSDSESVIISTDGQTASVKLSYELILWDSSGSVNEDVSGGWTGMPQIDMDTVGTTKNLIDVTSYNTLVIGISGNNTWGTHVAMGLYSASGSYLASFTVFASNAKPTIPDTVTVDISNVTEACYIRFENKDGYNASGYYAVSSVILKP